MSFHTATPADSICLPDIIPSSTQNHQKQNTTSNKSRIPLETLLNHSPISIMSSKNTQTKPSSEQLSSKTFYQAVIPSSSINKQTDRLIIPFSQSEDLDNPKQQQQLLLPSGFKKNLSNSKLLQPIILKPLSPGRKSKKISILDGQHIPHKISSSIGLDQQHNKHLNTEESSSFNRTQASSMQNQQNTTSFQFLNQMGSSIFSNPSFPKPKITSSEDIIGYQIPSSMKEISSQEHIPQIESTKPRIKTLNNLSSSMINNINNKTTIPYPSEQLQQQQQQQSHRSLSSTNFLDYLSHLPQTTKQLTQKQLRGSRTNKRLRQSEEPTAFHKTIQQQLQNESNSVRKQYKHSYYSYSQKSDLLNKSKQHLNQSQMFISQSQLPSSNVILVDTNSTGIVKIHNLIEKQPENTRNQHSFTKYQQTINHRSQDFPKKTQESSHVSFSRHHGALSPQDRRANNSQLHSQILGPIFSMSSICSPPTNKLSFNINNNNNTNSNQSDREILAARLCMLPNCPMFSKNQDTSQFSQFFDPNLNNQENSEEQQHQQLQSSSNRSPGGNNNNKDHKANHINLSEDQSPSTLLILKKNQISNFQTGNSTTTNNNTPQNQSSFNQKQYKPNSFSSHNNNIFSTNSTIANTIEIHNNNAFTPKNIDEMALSPTIKQSKIQLQSLYDNTPQSEKRSEQHQLQTKESKELGDRTGKSSIMGQVKAMNFAQRLIQKKEISRQSQLVYNSFERLISNMKQLVTLPKIYRVKTFNFITDLWTRHSDLKRLLLDEDIQFVKFPVQTTAKELLDCFKFDKLKSIYEIQMESSKVNLSYDQILERYLLKDLNIFSVIIEEYLLKARQSQLQTMEEQMIQQQKTISNMERKMEEDLLHFNSNSSTFGFKQEYNVKIKAALEQSTFLLSKNSEHISNAESKYGQFNSIRLNQKFMGGFIQKIYENIRKNKLISYKQFPVKGDTIDNEENDNY